MKKTKIFITILVVLLISHCFTYAQLIPNLGGQRVGISALQFLKIGVGARGTALGGSFVAVTNDASALYWNPAGLIQTEGNQLFISHTQYVADINHEFVGATYKLTPSDVFGISIISLGTDDMPVTNETNPLGTGRMFKYSDLAIGLSYARQMTNQFSFGATVKYVEETLDVLKMRTFLVDLGTYYWTGLGSVRFAVVVNNFGSDVSPSGSVELYDGRKVTSFQSFSPPTLFKVGLAFEPFETESQKLTTSIQLNHPNDNAENIRLGAEYTWNDMFSVRAGLKRSIGEPILGKDGASEEDITFGAGVKVPISIAKINVDYAYANFNRLGGVHRISIGIPLDFKIPEKAPIIPEIPILREKVEKLKVSRDSLVGENQKLKIKSEQLDNTLIAEENKFYELLGASKEDIELFGNKLIDVENTLNVYEKLTDDSLSIYESDIYKIESVIKEMKLSKISRLERYIHKIDNIEKRTLSLITRLPKELIYIVNHWSKTKECLWMISKKKEIYGNALLWVKIWNANKDVIMNPDLIKPGMKLKIPKSKEITSEEAQLLKLYYKK